MVVAHQPMKTDLLASLRLIADPTRLRLIALLEKDELSVNEIQEVTHMGQSRISTHLAQLQKEGFVQSRRDGKRVYYGLCEGSQAPDTQVLQLALKAGHALEHFEADNINLGRILDRRQNQALFFNQVAGRFDRRYGPGRSWQAFGQMLLRMMPALDIADLGSGEASGRAAGSECVSDRRRQQSEHGRVWKAEGSGNGLPHLYFRCGNLEDPPLDDASVDVATLSQALHHADDPSRAIASAYRILRPGAGY